MLEKQISDMCTENLFFLITGLLFIFRGLFYNLPPTNVTMVSTICSCMSVISVET